MKNKKVNTKLTKLYEVDDPYTVVSFQAKYKEKKRGHLQNSSHRIAIQHRVTNGAKTKSPDF